MSRLRIILLGLGLLVASCAGQNPRALSPADVAAGCGLTTPAPCEAACFRGSGAACAIFGSAVSGWADAPVRLPQDRPRGRKALDVGCRLGNLEACREVVGYDIDVAPAETCSGVEALCSRGDPRSCSFFGQCLHHVEAFRRDKARAFDLFRQGCDRGEQVACQELAFQALNGDSVTRDYSKAFALFDKACRLDQQLACAYEGQLLERGQGVPRDVERAKALYRVACARGIRPIPCEGLRHFGEVPPSTVVSSADAAESSYISQRFDYEWRLPANWELVPPATLDLSDAPASTELAAARPRGRSSPDSLVFAVSDGRAASGTLDGDPAVLAGLEEEAASWFAAHGIAKTKSSRTKFLGMEAVRFEGTIEHPTRRFLVLTLFRRYGRQFAMRCLTAKYQSHLFPCADAFGALMIHAPLRDPTDYPRVLHLRESRFDVSFDAPDDSWLSFGPRTPKGVINRVDAAGPVEQYWYWTDGEGRRIDVSVRDLVNRGFPGESEMPTERFVASLADFHRRQGGTVVVQSAVLAGQPCGHLQIDRPNERPEDLFIQRRGQILYELSVMASPRDPALVEQVRAGLRIGTR